jgi:hypothetical protein
MNLQPRLEVMLEFKCQKSEQNLKKEDIFQKSARRKFNY